MDRIDHVGQRFVALSNELDQLVCPACGGSAFTFSMRGKDVMLHCRGLVLERDTLEAECEYARIYRASNTLELPKPVFREKPKPRVRILFDQTKDQ